MRDSFDLLETTRTTCENNIFLLAAQQRGVFITAHSCARKNKKLFFKVVHVVLKNSFL